MISKLRMSKRSPYAFAISEPSLRHTGQLLLRAWHLTQHNSQNKTAPHSCAMASRATNMHMQHRNFSTSWSGHHSSSKPPSGSAVCSSSWRAAWLEPAAVLVSNARAGALAEELRVLSGSEMRCQRRLNSMDPNAPRGTRLFGCISVEKKSPWRRPIEHRTGEEPMINSWLPGGKSKPSKLALTIRTLSPVCRSCWVPSETCGAGRSVGTTACHPLLVGRGVRFTGPS